MLALVLVFGLVLAACGGGQQAAPQPTQPPAQPEQPKAQPEQPKAGDPAKGKELYAGSCAACHGPDAKGLPNLGKDLTASEFVKSLSDSELLEFIKKGRPASDPENTTGVDMPPKGGNPALTDEQLMDIIAYIRTLEE
jgi:disulfide bond formation protein DsbB